MSLAVRKHPRPSAASIPVMWRYYQVLLRTVVPPIACLGYLYAPLFGRRDALKIVWLALMATLWTTPWDNWIISRSAWSYPSHSVLFTIFYVPIEEQAFFILQPTLLILLHSIMTLPHMIPFKLPERVRRIKVEEMQRAGRDGFEMVQTLRRRPAAASAWIAAMGIGFALLARDGHAFYLGCILAWISPVIALLTALGARSADLSGERWTYGIGIGWLWIVDTIGIRSNAWEISEAKTLGINLWRGLPVEEALFFVLTTHLILLSSSLISHLHTLLLLSPPPYYPSRCPPRNPIRHITLLARLAIDPPPVDAGVLVALRASEETLRRGSKSFTLAKVGWQREMRCGLVAVYGWCRVTDNLIDEATSSRESREMVGMMKAFLDCVYNKGHVDDFLATIPAPAFPAFYLFSRLLPGMIPRHAFDDLVQGYEMDLAFAEGPIRECSPIRTHDDLILYADRVAGSVADMICHLAWAILQDEHGARPDAGRGKIVEKAREMGQALQLVNIARDIRTDALLGRLYIPLEESDDLDLVAECDYARWTLPLLATANTLRQGSAREIGRLPRTARAGTRAMVASYFEIGKEVERRGGKLDAERLRVPTWRRVGAVLRCFWGWSRT